LVAKRRRKTLKHKRYRLRSVRGRKTVGGTPDGEKVEYKISAYTPENAHEFKNKITNLAEGVERGNGDSYESGLHTVLTTTYPDVLIYLRSKEEDDDVHLANPIVWLVEQFVGERRSFCITLIHIERKYSVVMPPLSSNRYCMQIGIYKTNEQYTHEKQEKKNNTTYERPKLREQLQTFVESMAKGEQTNLGGPKPDEAYSHILVCPLIHMGYNLLMGGFKVLCPKNQFTFAYISQYVTDYNSSHLCKMVNQDMNDDQKVNLDDFDSDEVDKFLRITKYPQFKKIVIDDVEIMRDLLRPPKNQKYYEVNHRGSTKTVHVKPADVLATTDSDKLQKIIQTANYITKQLCYATQLLCKPLNTAAPPTSNPTAPSNTANKVAKAVAPTLKPTSPSNTANKVAKAVAATAVAAAVTATAIKHTLQQQNKQ
jgi:hypothetical protein